MTKLEVRDEIKSLRQEIVALRTEMRAASSKSDREFTLLGLPLGALDRELDGLQNHVRGLEAVVREGFAGLTELINTSTESGSHLAR